VNGIHSCSSKERDEVAAIASCRSRFSARRRGKVGPPRDPPRAEVNDQCPAESLPAWPCPERIPAVVGGELQEQVRITGKREKRLRFDVRRPVTTPAWRNGREITTTSGQA